MSGLLDWNLSNKKVAWVFKRIESWLLSGFFEFITFFDRLFGQRWAISQLKLRLF